MLALPASYDIFCNENGYCPKGFTQFWQDYIDRHDNKSGFNQADNHNDRVAMAEVFHFENSRMNQHFNFATWLVYMLARKARSGWFQTV